MTSWSEHELSPRWIPLTVERPAEGRVVWVWVGAWVGAEKVKARRSGEGWLRADTGEWIGEVVTHFMWVRE